MDTFAPCSLLQKTDWVEFLLKNGANVNAKNYDGSSPFHGDLLIDRHIFNLLITYGANINALTSVGESFLHVAIKNGNELTVIEFLLDWGASPNTRNDEGFTPIECALEKKTLSSLKMMIINEESEAQGDCFKYIQDDSLETVSLFEVVLSLLSFMSTMWLLYESRKESGNNEDASCYNYVMQCMTNYDEEMRKLFFCKSRSLMNYFCEN